MLYYYNSFTWYTYRLLFLKYKLSNVKSCLMLTESLYLLSNRIKIVQFFCYNYFDEYSLYMRIICAVISMIRLITMQGDGILQNPNFLNKHWIRKYFVYVYWSTTVCMWMFLPSRFCDYHFSLKFMELLP